jgi:membrane fusion protein, multidrug efflux system
MKNNKTWLILLLIIAGLVLIKIFFLDKPEADKQGSKPNAGKPSGVKIYIAREEQPENKLFATGTILANEEAELVPEVSGKIVLLNIREGGTVSQGMLLVKINDAELQAQLKKLKAQEELLKDREVRQKKLLDISGISKEEYETSVNALFTVRADIEMVQAQINKTEIRAPFDGIVGLKNVSAGSFISPGVKIAGIQQINPVKIDFSVPERYAMLISRGSKIRFSAEGVREVAEAEVAAVEPKIDIATRTIRARALYKNKEAKFLPGAFAKIELLLDARETSIMIPSEALIPVLKGYKVFVYKNGLARETKVVTGLRTENRVEIVEGLSAGDSVITTGIMQLKKDSPVKLVKN